MEKDSNYVLYILMRQDLPSMNAGKAMAQASHASNAFIYEALKRILTCTLIFVSGKNKPNKVLET